MQDIESAVQNIQRGNEKAREELIASQKTFIYTYTCFICKRSLSWQNDDELSIALIAFNRAIDTYDCTLNSRFISYAKRLMKNSLVDFFRRQKQHGTVGLHPGGAETETSSAAESAAAWDSHLREIENRDRAYEIQAFEKALQEVGLTLEELAKSSPRHRDTREMIKEAALRIAEKPELAGKLHAGKRLPLKEIQQLTGTKKKTLQKWRKYLLSLVILLTRPDMESLVEYIWGRRSEGDE